MQTEAIDGMNQQIEMSLKMSSIRLGPQDIKNKIDFNDKSANVNGYEMTEISLNDDSHFMENETFYVNELTGEIIGEDVFQQMINNKGENESTDHLSMYINGKMVPKWALDMSKVRETSLR